MAINLSLVITFYPHFSDLPCLCTADVTFRRVSFWSLLKYMNISYVGMDIKL